MLTQEQRIYLVQCYGIGDVTYARAIELFHIRFPNVNATRQNLQKIIEKFVRTGSVADVKKQRKEYNEDDAATLLVLDSVRDNPSKSLRIRQQELMISKSHIQKILKVNQYHPYKPHFLHKLEDGDDALRLDFSLTLGEKIDRNRNFHKRIIFSDESTFSTNGHVSSQNARYWTQDNPNYSITTNSQKFKKVNVWCAMTPTKIIGPYFLDGALNQDSYLHLLDNFFWPQLDEENLDFRQKMHFQQDGCPAHSTYNVRDWLDHKFPGKWIGRFGPIAWPARSPDLTTMDFFLWGYLKQKVFHETVPDDVNILKNKIREAVETVTEEMLGRVYNEFKKRLELCVERGGLHIE